MTKKIFSLLLAITLSFFSFFPVVSAHVAEKRFTIESYKEFLREKNPEILENFSKFPKEKQEIFLEYINAPGKILQDINKNNSPVTSSLKKNITPETSFRSNEQIMKAEAESGIDLFGIKILVIKMWVKYRVVNGSITEIVWKNIADVWNPNVFSDIDFPGQSAYITNNEVHYTSDVVYHVIHKGFNASVGSGDMGVVGWRNGYLYGWYNKH